MHRFVVVAVVLGIAGCSADEPPAPSVLEGVITDVSTGAGGEVTGFDLEAGEERYEILIDPGRDYGFDLAHLNEHRDTGDPVRLRLTERDSRLYALRIDDA